MHSDISSSDINIQVERDSEYLNLRSHRFKINGKPISPMKATALSGRLFAIGLLAILAFGKITHARHPLPPKEILLAKGYGQVLMPDGTIEHFFTEGEYGDQTVMRIVSSDHGQTWSEAMSVIKLPPEGKWWRSSPHSMVDRDGQQHLFILDIKTKDMGFWHTMFDTKTDEYTSLKFRSPLKYIGPSGPMTNPIQLRSGRILVPVGYMLLEGCDWDSPTGRWEITNFYSDDGGETWARSPIMAVHCPTDYPGFHEGGCEPVVIELNDGRVWMVIRNQNDWLYESFSKDGVHWSEPQATEFRSSDSPVSLIRLPGGEMVLFWNNCDAPCPKDGAFIYTGRDALHAAITKDEGKTWHGYREVYRDPYRNLPPPKRGDRGTAYSNSTATRNGHIVLTSGQGLFDDTHRRRLFVIDPAWLLETHHEDDFSKGLDNWSVFKTFGPPVYYWRNRTVGARLVKHPDKTGAKVLHIRRPDEKAGDGAVWNFPTGRIGKVTLRILLQTEFGGGLVTLADRFIFPDDTNLTKVAFALPISSKGQLGKGPVLEMGRWYTIKLDWKVEHKPITDRWPGECAVSVDGEPAITLPQLHRAKAGLCYLRLHSTAEAVDQAGFLIERVTADIE